MAFFIPHPSETTEPPPPVVADDAIVVNPTKNPKRAIGVAPPIHPHGNM